jgi:DNA helicase II / ATP-dependent DNA helicase PcrA
MNRIVQEEEQLLATIRQMLLERPVVSQASEKDIVVEMRQLRDDIAQAKTEDKGAMLQQFDQLHALLKQIRNARQVEDVDPDNPYFAHMRLSEEKGERDLYLGKSTRIDHGLRIIDWRNAPIAQLFYRYQEGEEYAEEVGDRIFEGVLAARRTVSVQRGRLDRVASPQGVFTRDATGEWEEIARTLPKLAGGEGESLLQHNEVTGQKRKMGVGHVSGRSRDKHLPDIAALIDKEQFELITQPKSGLVVIRGIAGSGKTTVALHRVAYLNYQDPHHFRADRIIIVVWGRALRDYISKVLPSLGVEGVKVVTWSNFARGLVKRHFPFLPRHVAEDTPEVVSRMKLHPAFFRMMEEHVAGSDGPRNGEGVFEDFLSLTFDLKRMAGALVPAGFSMKEVERAWDWCRRQREVLGAWAAGDRDERAELDEEDDAVLLRLWQLRVGPLRAKGKRPLKFAHMVVDEVQDLSPIEVAILLDTLDNRRSVTLSGDTQQHIVEQAGFHDWDDFFAHLGLESQGVNTLKVSYRSTHEITSFARKVLGDLAEDDTPPMTTRPGEPVELFRFTDHGACVAFLADALGELTRREPLASIALLTPSPHLSGIYYDGLRRAEVPNTRRVIDQEFEFAPGIDVVEMNEVKGLEFDYVVLVEVSVQYFPENSHARRLLHVGATRAAHQLWLTAVGTPSPLIRD